MLLKPFFLIIISVSLSAEITLKEISEKPSGRAKNFLIWQYLKQDINQYQAKEAYSQVSGNHYKLNKAYLKHNPKVDKKSSYKVNCRANNKLLEIKNQECLQLAFTPYKTLQLTNKQRDLLKKRMKYKKDQELISLQNEKVLEGNLIKYSPNTIVRYIYTSGYRYRRAHLNKDFSQQFMNILAESPLIDKMIQRLLYLEKVEKLQDSFLKINPELLSSKSNFNLGLMAINQNNDKKALEFFRAAYEITSRDSLKDKNLFWMYQVSKEKKYLEQMIQSSHINIYSLFAHEKMGTNPRNYFINIPTNKKHSKKNLQDPFVWEKIYSQIKDTPKGSLVKLSKDYQHDNMSVVNRFIIEKMSGYSKHGFLMPYNKYLKELNNDDKALVYAIMRQESAYIPSALSRSFALGLMQLMPFLVDALAKEKKEIIEYKDMFNPEKNIEYAIRHLRWMQKRIKHPLFIAYGYNGGTGFLRRHLKTGAFRIGKYEPYLSMEMMQNSETREYGKKVLSNYVMYKKILGEKVSLINTFENVIPLNHIRYSLK